MFWKTNFLWNQRLKRASYHKFQFSSWAWCGFKTRGFFTALGTLSVPRLLFRFLFRVSFGRTIGLPCESTEVGLRAWWSISQQRLLLDGLQIYTMPVTSRVQPRQNVVGFDLQPGTIQEPWKPPFIPPFPHVCQPASSSELRIGKHSNSKATYIQCECAVIWYSICRFEYIL